jgi:zinc protease
MKFPSAWGAALLSAATVAAPAVAEQGDVREHSLPNGMKIIVMEDHRAPTVASMVWYRAGSMDELSGTTGVAHVLEHMMFKGTKGNAPDMFARTIAAAGGRDNAFTNRDYTAYFQQLHKSKLPLALGLEADRMQNLVLSGDEFAKEIKVVMEERRLRTEDQPRALLFEQMMAVAYTGSPYKWPIVGWMNDLESMTVEDARAWYDRWYTPNNATLVVVGDVDPQEVFRVAEAKFGPIPARELPVRKPQIEPAQRGIKRLSVKGPGELPYLLMGWHVPVVRDMEKDWEPYALSMLVGVLDGSDAARLDRTLVREARVAVSAGASYDSVNRGPGMFFMDGVPAPGTSVAELEAALRTALRKVIDEGVSDEELQRVKAQVIAGRVFQRDSMFYQAMQIGMLNTVGLPYDSADLQERKLREVTAEQVREVARKYFVDDNLTVAVLDPQSVAPRAAAPTN